MKYMTSAEVRQTFLNYFQEHGHNIEPSQSLVPVNDPTLLWINSGVATMKKYFDGSVVPENPRMTSSQKSIRTNDIENVGKTARHHTMFEMMGNFSIGDYFRKEAIFFAFDMLTNDKYFGFPKEKLYVTYYPDDKDTYNRWIEVGLDASHLVPIEDNFWEIGAGPSGPDTEIFFDRGEKYDPESIGLRLLAEDIENDRYIEIYNVVLSQFNADPSVPRSEYKELPQKNIDTGMGLERMVCIIQGGRTNFDTDLFLPIIAEIEKLSGKKYDENGDNMSFKVIADHIRSLSFAIGDGALPGNEGRGYVLRRLLRRAVMHGKKLGIQGKFLAGLVPVVGKIMESYYPEVLEKADFIEKIIDREEETFNKTIDAGQKLIDELLVNLKKEGKDTIDGQDIFRLYDTYGFPVELTEELAEDEGFKIDHAGFEAAMKEQQDRARAAVVKGGSMGAQNETLSSIEVESTFLYEDKMADAKLLVAVKDNELVEDVTGKAQLVFDVTPFYAEMGGQVADHGVIKNKSGVVVANVIDVQHAPHGQNLHSVEILSTLKVGETYHLEIDQERRNAVVKNHTATHLLHAALHNIVGQHALQAGSLNEVDFLRFDFTHFAQVTKEELAAIERQVNEKIWENIAIQTRTDLTVEQAKEMGAAALFGQKYGKNVRVVIIGDYSVELCGGTHTKTTSEIGMFKIVKEEGIGSGVRRIIAVTGQKAFEAFKDAENTLNEVATAVKAPQANQVLAKITALNEELKTVQKEKEALADKLAASQSEEVFKNVQTAGTTSFIASQVTVSDASGLRNLADIWKQKELSDVLVLVAKIGEKVNLLVASKSADIKAGNLVKELAPMINGRGGGKPDMAMAGGSDASGIPNLLSQVATKLN